MAYYWNTVSFLLFLLLHFLGYLGSIGAQKHSNPLSAFSDDDENDMKEYENSPIECECFNTSNCPNSTLGHSRTKCKRQRIENDPCCFTAWIIDKDTNISGIISKDCWLQSCSEKSKCIRSNAKDRITIFCTCEGMMCNQNLTLPDESTVKEESKEQQKGRVKKKKEEEEEEEEEGMSIELIFVSIFFFVLLCVLFAYYIYYHRKGERIEATTLVSIPSTESSPNLNSHSIQLVEIEARGQYGTVWKSRMNSNIVAVKVFPTQHKKSWQSEQEIFKLPHMNHECILEFFGVQRRDINNFQEELWLITSYHEKGSLYDYLKRNVVSWTELYKITDSMAKGLMHLHEEIFPNENGGYKPVVVHRDFKSQNVLLKSDMSACIADFGLALIFDPQNPPSDIQGQIGTRRYMAPEVLEGSINFSRDSFMRIDMYAFGLVLWELASRCTAQNGPVPEYKLPFDEEMGSHSTLEEWQENIIHKKIRPIISETWRKHLGLSFMCETIQEAWDDDPEARVTAACVVERTSTLENDILINTTISMTVDSPETSTNESNFSETE